MTHKALFQGLIIDEAGKAVDTGMVGDDPCYIVDDAGFRRHIASEQVDRQILSALSEQIKEHEDLVADQATKMIGKDDLFTRAAILTQLKNMDKQIDMLLEVGIPEETRAYLGMMGFHIVINYHGDVIKIEQPGAISGEDDGE